MNTGLIIRSAGLWYDLLDQENNHVYKARLRGKFKKNKSKVTNPIAVGDLVTFEEESKEENTAIIQEILPRTNYVIRESTHKKTHAHIIAANVDLAVLVVTLAMPRTSTGFIDRFLVSTESYGIPSMIVFNKADLLNEVALEIQQELSELYESIGYKCLLVSALQGDGMEQLKVVLEGKKTLIAGHSGVGKSTIINHLIPDIEQKTSEISSFANKGVHTTTFAEMFQQENNTFLIDTPGIKEFGILDLEEREIGLFFPEFREIANKCKFYNCTHIHEPHCAVIEKVESGEIALSRYESYVSIFHNEDNRR